jgi:phosphatidylethanolamine/phosphatidyl-N-methylethanolamine N-methyltransferase
MELVSAESMVAYPFTERSPTLGDAAFFMRCVLAAPVKTGAVLPSSRWLARTVTGVLAEFAEPNVVELGPGTGPMTRYIQQRLDGAGRHVAIELNPAFARRLTGRFPRVDVVCDTAAALPQIIEARQMRRVDAVISGLPFAVIPGEVQNEIIDGVARTMRPERGVFTTFAYLGAFNTPRARRFRALLLERFHELVVSRPVLRNIPPAYVLTARRVRSA